MNIFQVIQALSVRFPWIGVSLRWFGRSYLKGAAVSGGPSLTRTSQQHLRGLPVHGFPANQAQLESHDERAKDQDDLWALLSQPRDNNGYEWIVSFHDRPGGPLGNRLIQICRDCKRTPGEGHAPDCVWLEKNQV